MTKRYKMRLDGIFTSNAVFPEGKEIRIFGDGEGTAKVSFCGATAHAVSVGGRWEAVLPAMERGGPYTLELELNGEHTALEGIYIGKVYIFAGQSNMQFKLYESTTSPEACRPSPKMRLFSTDRLEQGEPFCFRDGWVEADRDNIDRWPAIPYLVSEYISEKENVAVGAITCYQGASVIESWVPCGAFKKIGIDIPVSELAPDHTYEKYRIWNGDGYLYSHTFSRIAPYSVNGVIWYQGESDTSVSEGREYAGELEELIRDKDIAVLSVGTGSVNDPCRLACARQNKKLCIFATAPSMDGFASYSSPIVKDGFKESYPAKSPEVIIGDTKILAAAPTELKSSGFGDMIAKYVGLADWRISHILTGETYCERVASLTRTAVDELMSMADKVCADDEYTAGKIFEALLKTGTGMSFMQNSRPASGSEHIIAHLIECKELPEGKLPNLHGEDVGVCTLEMLKLYNTLAAKEKITAAKG